MRARPTAVAVVRRSCRRHSLGQEAREGQDEQDLAELGRLKPEEAESSQRFDRESDR